MPRKRNQHLLQAIGGRVAEARQNRGLTQAVLSELVEIETVSLSRLETGNRALSLSTLYRISEALRVGLGDLLDVERPLATPELEAEEVELLRLFGSLEKSQRRLAIKLIQELAR